MALASAARSEPGGWPPAASSSSRACWVITWGLPGVEMKMPEQARKGEQPLYALASGDQRKLEAVALGVERPPGQQRDPGRVHEVQPAQVDDDPPEPVGGGWGEGG